MTVKKVMLGATLVLGLSVFSLPTLEVSADTEVEPKWLTSEEIDRKFEEINVKYGIGEEMAIEDQEFIKTYADKPMLGISGKDQIQPYKTNSFTKYRTVAGIEARTWGTASSTHGAWNNTYGANMTTQTFKGNATKLSNTVTHTAYGLVGSGGVGKVFSNSLTSSCNNRKSCKLNKTEKYGASVAYSNTVVRGTVHYPGGSFSINP
ncbi:hypothetical protein CN491_24175 [Bacillus cereus]|uniref:Uncharacterized protein n=1 Tax=Bacillus cereus TaxID=1396 RepID=A0A2A8LIX3_BACCE|nr:hypothetical protein [Bacillus cereus]MEA1012678.1 hypothetical protein [Bacillus cereus]PES90518.1 hypothetical protein CN491_24175 [Bacillus cereus]PFP71860.1 hypothetical protein COJ95_23500 [Bacillus cereus]